MNMPITREEVRAVRGTRERVAGLIGRYPNLSDEETQEIITFLRTGRHLDVGLLTSSERLRPKLDAFMQRHHRQLRLKSGEAAIAIAAIVSLLVIILFVAEAFS